MEVCGEEGADAGDVILESAVRGAGCEERERGWWQRGGELEGEQDYEFEELGRERWCLRLERERIQ